MIPAKDNSLWFLNKNKINVRLYHLCNFLNKLFPSLITEGQIQESIKGGLTSVPGFLEVRVSTAIFNT